MRVSILELVDKKVAGDKNIDEATIVVVQANMERIRNKQGGALWAKFPEQNRKRR
jgi:hypothetical protein